MVLRGILGVLVMGTDAKAVVRVSTEERVMLEKVLGEPRVAKDRVLRIKMLLKSDASGPKWSDSRIGEAFDVVNAGRVGGPRRARQSAR